MKTCGKAEPAKQPEKFKEKVESSMESQDARFKPGCTVKTLSLYKLEHDS